jgi:signal transduction histidine kinase
MKTQLLLVVMLAISAPSFSQKKGQDKIDSLVNVLKTVNKDSTKVNTLNALAYEFRSNNPDTALYFADKALALATKTNYTMGIAVSNVRKGIALMNLGEYDDAVQASLEVLKISDQLLKADKGPENDTGKSSILRLKSAAYGSLGNIYDSKGDYTTALKNDFEALKISEEIGDKAGIGSTYNNIGNIYAAQGNYPAALKNLLAGLKIKEETGDKKSIANSYNNIGIIYGYQKDYTQALKYHFASLKLREETGDKRGIASSYNNIGIIYEDQQKYPDALKYHFDALKIEEETGDDPGIAESHYHIGHIYMSQEDYPQALKNYFAGLKIWQEIGDNDGVATSYIDIGNVYNKQKKIGEASLYLNKGLSLSKEIGSLAYIKDAYEGLAKSDSLQGNFKEALEHYKLYINYRDSIFNEENTKKLVQSQMQYEFDKKESVARAEQEKKDAIAQREKNKQYFTIASLGILVFAGAIIALIQWRNNKQKQTANSLLAQQKAKVESTLAALQSTQAQLIHSEKMASLGELTAGIAHEIQNPLNFVNNFSEVNAELANELQEALQAGKIKDAISISNDIKDNEEKINHHGKRADAIVKGMLLHSRSSSGVKEPTDINALCDEYLRLSYHGLRAKDKDFNATLNTDFDAGIGKINIIPQDIGRVLLNLYNNALYAVNEKKKQIGNGYTPTVTVSTKKAGNKIEVRIADNGNGVPQKALDKIFQPFFTTKPTGQGTGLGLSLSYDTIKAHGGVLEVETKEGQFAEFMIRLPQ